MGKRNSEAYAYLPDPKIVADLAGPDISHPKCPAGFPVEVKRFDIFYKHTSAEYKNSRPGEAPENLWVVADPDLGTGTVLTDSMGPEVTDELFDQQCRAAGCNNGANCVIRRNQQPQQ